MKKIISLLIASGFTISFAITAIQFYIEKVRTTERLDNIKEQFNNAFTAELKYTIAESQGVSALKKLDDPESSEDHLLKYKRQGYKAIYDNYLGLKVEVLRFNNSDMFYIEHVNFGNILYKNTAEIGGTLQIYKGSLTSFLKTFVPNAKKFTEKESLENFILTKLNMGNKYTNYFQDVTYNLSTIAQENKLMFTNTDVEITTYKFLFSKVIKWKELLKTFGLFMLVFSSLSTAVLIGNKLRK